MKYANDKLESANSINNRYFKQNAINALTRCLSLLTKRRERPVQIVLSEHIHKQNGACNLKQKPGIILIKIKVHQTFTITNQNKTILVASVSKENNNNLSLRTK